MRTTINIDDPILKELERLARREGKPLGRLVSDLLARSLAEQRAGESSSRPDFNWIARPMHARVDPSDKHAPLDAMDKARGALPSTSTSCSMPPTRAARCIRGRFRS